MSLIGLTYGLVACKFLGVLPNVMIEVRSEKDRYDNDVSMIRFPDGTYYRMVHRSPEDRPIHTATIYGGRGKFVRFKSWFNTHTKHYTGCEVAGYNVRWYDDGRTELMYSPEDGPDLRAQLEQIKEGFLDVMIGVVMTQVAYHDLWQISRSQERQSA
ncbi:hypothetical protein EVB87_111 [Rhizobium phage RHph_N28_1]|nr:hypothetical protein EVB87_111 [Rhizobium phage RHph_N28_1]QIG74140.1 hypothetical protein EVC07_112 [Rhizobium phage RHph_N42]QIG74744.1 hypothetical protein EVC12_109 [Rhizobium phage RHph_I42]QXV73798.1 hypothetical protein [Rhizobium phage RHph_N46]